jgi:hypothetical protein
MGSTMFEGGSITKCFHINQVKLSQTKINLTYKDLQNVTMLQLIQKIQRYTNQIQDTPM